MDKKNAIREMIDKFPKHYVFKIRANNDLNNYVLANSTNSCKTYAEKIYQSLTGSVETCEYDNNKKFKNINEGYGFCGRASSCRCAKESVSKAVSTSWSKKSKSDMVEIQKKRELTNFEKYGHVNSGQSETAKKRHREFYNNSTLVSSTTKKIKDTKLSNHGSENYNNYDKIKETFIKKYGVDNPLKNSDIKVRALATKVHNFDRESNIKKTFTEVKGRIRERFNLELLLDIDDYDGVISRPLWTFRCITCDHVFTKRYDAGAYPKCSVCNPRDDFFKSSQELEIYEYISNRYTGKMISGDRSIINPYEVDIYLPELCIAIEFCGLYWHSELSSGRKFGYHKTKFDMLSEKGIQLITIFSDEFEENKEIVLSSLMSKIGGLGNNKIYARKTTCIEVPRSLAKDFFNKFHIQGYAKTSDVFLGLYHNGDLVALNSFSKMSETEYELTRYATSSLVVGGASKILSNFINNWEVSKITTFSDNRWSNGALYEKLGFTKCGNVPPMQYYVENYKKRYNKRWFSRDKFSKVDPNRVLTEWQIMQKQGYDRIWDCGKIKWCYEVDDGTVDNK